MAVTVFEGVDAVRAATGCHLGWSEWTTITRDQIAAFAEATGNAGACGACDAGADGAAPEYLTLAITNMLLPQVVEVCGVSLGVNRGTGMVRFGAPAPVGARLRAGVELRAVQDVAGGVDTTMVITVERDGGDEPVCVVEGLSRFLA